MLERIETTPEDDRHSHLDQRTIENLRDVTRASIEVFIRRLDDPGCKLDTEPFNTYGRVQFASGRSLDEMLWFYRVGANATWQYAAEHPDSGELPARMILQFGRLLLDLVDELSSSAVDGYVAEQTTSLRQEIVKREQLHSLLMSGSKCPPDVLLAAAKAAQWKVPERVRVAVASMPFDPPAGFQLAAPGRVLSGPLEGGRRSLIVADDSETERWLLRAAAAMSLPLPLAIGPSVEPLGCAMSVERAMSLLSQVEDGVVRSVDKIVRSDDHEIDLILACAPDLAESLAERCLKPITTIGGAQRDRMIETLAAWLADPGRPQAMADRLGIHVQTVRYRLRFLRELFGGALDDPEARFELAVALRFRATPTHR